MFKTCSYCRESLSYDNFNKNKTKSDGLHNYCKKCHRKKAETWASANKEKANQRSKNWYENNKENKETSLKRSRDWYYANREKSRAAAKNWREMNPEKRKEQSTKYETQRRRNDPKYKLIHNLRARLRMALRSKYKKGSAVRDLGMPVDAFLTYLNLDALDKYGIPYTGNESKFHIDHIRPLASFNLEDAEQLKQAVHWSNLQILRAEENLAKGARTP